jgi:hypothetical protein
MAPSNFDDFFLGLFSPWMDKKVENEELYEF